MRVVERPAGRNRADTMPALDEQSLRSALKTLRIAQRMLANGAAEFAGPHIQLALELLEPLAPQSAACALLPIDGGKLDSTGFCASAATRKAAT